LLLARSMVAASGIALAVVLFVILAVTYGHPGDVVTYLAAGERLNAGHALYALAPGDRFLPVVPPYFTVPLVSPPLVAVVWRPLALLPEPVGVGLWWAAMLACLAVAVGMVLRVPRMLGPVSLLALSIPLGLEAVQGNINAIILLGAIVAWRAHATGHEAWAGAIVGGLVVLKVTPAILAVWLLMTAGRRGWLGLSAGLALAGGVSVLGAGIDAHLAYLAVMRDTTTIGPSDLSVAGIFRTLGMAPEIANRAIIAIDLAGAASVVLLRRRPSWAFRAAVVTMVLGSPVVFVNTFLLLLAALAPSLWPIRDPMPLGRAAAQPRTTSQSAAA
jgi:hypothetical protein